MTGTATDAREARLEDAAYRLIAEKGFHATSMLAVAKAAKASNQTLYKKYGDKIGLFKMLVARNADSVKREIKGKLSTDIPALYAIAEIAPTLLTMLLGTKAVALNQAAAGDPSGELGRALSDQGRNTIAPLFTKLIEKAMQEGGLAQADPSHVLQVYFNLLIGDLQVRRVTGAMPVPTPTLITARCQSAQDTLIQLFGPNSAAT